MKRIITKLDSDNDLTVFTVIGKVTADEIAGAVRDFYESNVTSNVLWDLIQSDLSEFSSSDVESIVGLSFKYAEQRCTGKTAIVGSDDLTFGLSRMYEIDKEYYDLPFETQTFRDIDEAYKWLQSG